MKKEAKDLLHQDPKAETAFKRKTQQTVQHGLAAAHGISNFKKIVLVEQHRENAGKIIHS